MEDLGTLDSSREDISEYGRQVQKRIKREWRKNKVLEEKMSEVQEQNQKLQNQLKEIQDKQHEQAKAGREQEIERYNTEMEKLDTELQEAIEDGDAKKQAKIQRGISKIEGRQAVAEARVIPERKEEEPEDPPPSEGEDKTHPAAKQFMEDIEWDELPPAARKEAIAIQGEMLEEGWKYSDRMFKELTTQLKKRAPEAFEEEELEDPDLPKDPPEEKPKPRRSPVSGQGAEPPKRKPAGEHFSQADLASMKKYNLEDTPENRANWLKHRAGGEL